jgi:hypothetical protein
MPRLFAFLFCLGLLAGCDSNDDPPADSSLFSVAVETPSGDPVAGLELMMEYALVGSNVGDRPAQPVELRYFNVAVLGVDLFRVEWETEQEEGVARFVVEARPSDGDFEDVAEVVPEGAGATYVVDVEGRYDAFRLRIEFVEGAAEYSEVFEVAEDDPPAFPAEVSLGPGYPNPFATVQTLSFTLSTVAVAALEVLDLEGRPAIQREGLPAGYLFQENRSPGQYEVAWEASEVLVGGFYRVRLTAGEDTATVLAVYTGQNADVPSDRLHIVSALGQTDAQGRFVTDDRALFPQRYAGTETEYRDENNVNLGVIRPSREIVLVLSDDTGREQRFERTLSGESNSFELTWDPE